MRTCSRTAGIVTISFSAVTYGGGAESAGCPPAIKAAVDKAFPQSTISRCKAEREHDRDLYEVKLVKADRVAVEVDVSTDGKIIQVEENIAVDKLPAAVMKAFTARYPKGKLQSAEKQTPSSGPISYELAFKIDSNRKEATFTETGKFVEEE